MAKKNLPSDALSALYPVVDGKLFRPLYLVAGVHCRAMSKAVDDTGTDCASFAKGARVQVSSTQNGILVTNKEMNSSPKVLNDASPAGNSLFI